jgi:hypothetical protein
MKCSTSKNIYLYAGAFVALVAIYVGFTMLKTTYEGLSNSADTTNVVIVAKTSEVNAKTTGVLNSLTSHPTSYINLLNSYKNNKIANAIQTTIALKNNSAFTTITDYDEAIDYLKTLGVSDTASVVDPAIKTKIDEVTSATNVVLSGLTADNQAYIDLLTSYRNKAMADGILNAATTTTTPILKISEFDNAIQYLRTLGGILVNNDPHIPTTIDISLAPRTPPPTNVNV